ncbi:MarR family transcriptional regulator [Streptomyces sp. NPDC017943]|uniref:MarR family transcriptional regulator n=1 Tax=Streptomyces sp. NPDC017943 TaxID=3365019 RepID=UPI0037BC1B81
MTIDAPPLNPRVIALAHYAGRAVLESVLTRLGLTFQQSVTLRLAALADGPVGREELAGGVTGALKTGAAEAHGVIGELLKAGLLTPEGTAAVRITDAGREAYTRASGQTAPYSSRIYAGIPEEDLAVAGRVLTLITRRAEAELAALPG